MTPIQQARETIQAKAREAAQAVWNEPTLGAPEIIDAMADAVMDAVLQFLDTSGSALLSREDREWQPIETAPKDGTELLLLIETAMGHYMRDVGHWFTATDRGWWTSHTMPVRPVGWLPMPLPAPPKGTP